MELSRTRLDLFRARKGSIGDDRGGEFALERVDRRGLPDGALMDYAVGRGSRRPCDQGCGLRPGAARTAQPLSVGYHCAVEIDAVAESLCHGCLEPGQLRVDGCTVLGTHVLTQVEQERAKAPDDLDGASAVLADLGDAERQVILPGA